MTIFHLRPPTEADIPELVTLLNTCWRELTGNEGTTEASLRTDWATPGFDPTTDYQVASTPTGELVGAASLFMRAPYVTHNMTVQVHPNWRGLGIGSALTEWAEQRTSEQLVLAPPEAHVTVNSGTLSTHQQAVDLLLARGYHLLRSFHEMHIVMDAPPPLPIWPPGLTVRPMHPEQDRLAAYHAHHDAFRDHFGYVPAVFEEDYPRWWHHLTEHPHYDPSTFFLVMDGEAIAAFAFCYPADYEMPDLAWIDALGVQRGWRRQGLALALLQHVFGEMYHRGVRRVGLAVDSDSLTGATRLYTKAGMSTFRQWDRYEKELRAGQDLRTQTLSAPAVSASKTS